MSDEDEVITLDDGDDYDFIEESPILAAEKIISEEKEEKAVHETVETENGADPVTEDKAEPVTEDKSQYAKDNKAEPGAEESQINDETEDKNKEVEEKEKSGKGKVKEEHSENFKVEMGGLAKYYSLGHLKKLLNVTLQLDAHRVKPGGMGRNVCYLDFKNEEARTKAKLILEGYKWNESTLTAIDADPTKDPNLLAKIEYLKVPKKEHESLPLLDRITKAVTPYHDTPYEDQIKEKDKVVKQVMRKFGNELSQMNPELKDFVHWHKMRRKGQVCEMDEFVQSPVKEGYRNYCEFIIGNNKESEDPAIGYRVASYKEGSVEVGGVSHLKLINEKTKEVVKSMEQFVKDSEHKPYDPFSHEGIWRQLTVRSSNNNDLMITVLIHPQQLSDDDIQAIKDSIVDYFVTGGGSEVGVTSIFLQRNSDKESGKEVDYEHLWGKEYIEETILGKTFRASPDAFLQPNTPASELLFTKIGEVLEIDQTTVLLDICSGVGTIGLSIAENAYKVFGVELNSNSVDYARRNCEINDVVNAVFYHGKAEDYIDNMIERSERVNTVAVVDPPNSGLNGSVMNALRKCEYLDKLVYITSDPQSALANFQALGRPRSKNYKGTYFVPIRACPIDMFPDTTNFELVIVFERYDECKWDRIMAGNPRPKDQAYFDRVPEMTFDPEQAKRDREEKRQKERDERRKDNPHSSRGGGRYDRWDGGGGREERGGSWGGDGRGYHRGWVGRRDDFDRGPRRYNQDFMEQPQQYGVGFQQGFRAGLEVLQGTSRDTGNPSGFGQGGGWNMAQTQQDYYNTNNEIGNPTAGGTWGAGYGRNTGAAFNSNLGEGGGMNSNTGYNSGGMGGFNNDIVDGGSGNTGWNQAQNYGGASNSWNSGGNSWNQNYQSFENPPVNKKWKGDYSNSGYNNYNYSNYKR